MTAAQQNTVQAAVDAGIRAGLLPENAAPTPTLDRPWSVVLLTSLGAWLAGVPLMVMAFFLFLSDVLSSANIFVVGGLMLCLAVVIMRSKGVPIFVEQMALPLLLVGAGTWGYVVFSHLGPILGGALMLVVGFVLAVAVPAAWLRVLLGVAAACLFAIAVSHIDGGGLWNGPGNSLQSLYGLLAVWLLVLWVQARVVSLGSLLESFAAGWFLTTLAGFVWTSGATFLVGAAISSNQTAQLVRWFLSPETGDGQTAVMQAGSSLLVLAGAAAGAIAWPSLRKTLPFAVALAASVLAWFIPTLGGVFLALVLLGASQRWRLASACGLALAWMIGGFYYQLQWSLSDKAMLLTGMGAVLGGLTWWKSLAARTGRAAFARSAPGAAVPAATWAQRAPKIAMLVGVALTLLVANVAIWQKQDLIVHGKPVFIALLPVDPRSLMQGDYMLLRFAFSRYDVPSDFESIAGKRALIVAKLDDRGVVEQDKWASGDTVLAADEIFFELTRKNGQWLAVSDAWFFKEGDGERWQGARYGEFRVLPDGRALLVGLTDEALQRIEP